jgi:N-acetylmuramoyl-L-alanine amidase
MRHELKSINTIVIHCSATREDKDYSVKQLLSDHKAMGFKTCGYHIYIKRDGSIYNGRPLNAIGAHAGTGHNTNSIGICYEGGLNSKLKAKDTRTEVQKLELLNSILSVLKAIKDAGGNPKLVKIVGHRDLSPDLDGDGVVEPNEWIKQCPCFEAQSEYKDIAKTF